MAHMTDEQWQKYRDVMNEWQEDAFQQEITWMRAVTNPGIHGEDNNDRYEDIPVKGLFQYNYFRAWPINQQTDTGEIDKESCLVYFNIKYLEEQGHLNQYKHFKFDPGLDRFKVNGEIYKPVGDSQAAQAKNNPLFIFIILKREETSTGDSIY